MLLVLACCGQTLVSDDVACVGMLQVADRDRGWSVRMLLALSVRMLLVLSVTMWLVWAVTMLLVLSVTMWLVWACCRLRTEAGQ